MGKLDTFSVWELKIDIDVSDSSLREFQSKDGKISGKVESFQSGERELSVRIALERCRDRMGLDDSELSFYLAFYELRAGDVVETGYVGLCANRGKGQHAMGTLRFERETVDAWSGSATLTISPSGWFRVAHGGEEDADELIEDLDASRARALNSSITAIDWAIQCVRFVF